MQLFRGNRNRNTIVMHSLRPAIKARVIRLHPLRWVGHISCRVEFYGRATGTQKYLHLCCNDICKWSHFLAFFDKDENRRSPLTTFVHDNFVSIKEPTQ